MDKMQNPFLATLRLPVKNSLILLVVLVSMHFICLFLPWLTGLSLYIKALLTWLVLVSFCFYLLKYESYKDNKHIAELILGSEDNWQVKTADGAVHHATLGHSLFVHPWLTIINLKYDNKRQYFIFTPETIDDDSFRRLRVRLRFKAEES